MLGELNTMLAHFLALAIAVGSFALYFSAFFFPEVHRKSDFYWSGLGFFYALVLWVCAGRITGAVLLGQTASVALLVWFGTQTLILRRALTPPAEKTSVSQNIATRLQTFWQKITRRKVTSTPPQSQGGESTSSSLQAEKETSEEHTPESSSQPSPSQQEEATSSSLQAEAETSQEATPDPSSESEKKNPSS